MDLKSNLLVDGVSSTVPYKDLEKNSTKTVCGKFFRLILQREARKKFSRN